MKIVDKNGLKISSTLFEFINNEAIPNTGVKIDDFWNKFSKVVHEMTPINKKLIQKRENIQKKIDDWHKSRREKDFDKNEYVNFLKSIGYLIEEKNNFNIETSEVDEEISSIAGPQLVVPVDNARYALKHELRHLSIAQISHSSISIHHDHSLILTFFLFFVR